MSYGDYRIFVCKVKKWLAEHDRETQLALQMQMEIDLQHSLKDTLASLHEDDRQDFIRTFHESHSLTLLTLPK